jgi:RHS repeat-associated protein
MGSQKKCFDKSKYQIPVRICVTSFVLFLVLMCQHIGYGQTPTKLTLTPSMVTTTSPIIVGKEPTNLVDEQVLAGDPAVSPTSNPVTLWGTNFAQQVMTAKIDLGANYVITKVFYYDGTGQEVSPNFYTITANAAGGDVQLVSSLMTGFNSWVGVTTNVTTRTLTIVNPTGYLGMNEIVLYGYAAIPPAAPTTLTALTSSTTQINLTWVDASSNESGFFIERSTTTGLNFLQVGTTPANTTTFADNTVGLSPGVKYFYKIRSNNTIGSSAYTAEASAVTNLVAPTGLSATPVSATGINLTWVDNSANETGYEVWRSTTSGGALTLVTTTAANATTFSNTGLAVGTPFFYKVRAVNNGALGISAYSAEVTATTIAAGAPAPPTTLAAVATSTTQINLTWVDASINETGFIIERATSSGGTFLNVTTTLANVTSYSNTGLIAGTRYFYRIRSTNASGGSVNTAEVSAVANLVAPTALTAVAASTTQINLTWVDNSANESGYEVYRSTTSGGALTLLTTTAANATTYSNTALTAGTQYFYKVRAVNNVPIGSSAYTAEATTTTISAGAPAPPTTLAAVATSTTQINLTWVDASANETGFIVERATSSGGTFLNVTTTLANVTSYSNTGLTAGTRYFYRIRSTNASGGSANTAEVSAVANLIAPTALTATPASATQINLTWIDNSANETGFVVERSTTTSTGFLALSPNAVANASSYTDVAAVAGTKYFYRVRAINNGGLGVSANTIEASATTTSGPPTAPSSLGAVGISTSTILLNWVDNSTTETGFKIERSTTGSGSGFSFVTTTSPNVVSYTDGGLLASSTYYYRISAVNANGSSAYTAEANAPTAKIGFRRFLLDFGDPATPTSTAGWNNITSVVVGTIIPLVESTGISTTLNLEVLVEPSANFGGGADFNPSGFNGLLADYPITASRDSHYAWAAGGTYRLNGLDDSKKYDLRVFGSRSSVSDARAGVFTVNGQLKTLEAANNTTQTLLFSNIVPSAGKIVINFNVAAGSTFGYINVLDIIENQALPAAPTTLAASPISSRQINLTWTDNSNNETNFVVERSIISGSGFSVISSTVPTNAVSYSDNTVLPSTQYFYRVLAINSSGSSAYTSQIAVTTPSEGLIPDADELSVLKTIAEGSFSDRLTAQGWPSISNWPLTATSAQFGSWGGVTVVNSDIAELSIYGDYYGYFPSVNLLQLKKLSINNALIYSLGGYPPSLEELRIGYNNFSEDIIFSSPSNLKFLGMSSYRYDQCYTDTYDPNRTYFDGPCGNPDLSPLVQLEYYEGDGNKFYSFPQGLVSLVNLKSIYLYNNYLQTVPNETLNFSQLQWLNLSKNYLIDLPIGLADLTALQSLDVSYNRLDFGDLEQFFNGVNALKKPGFNLEYGNQGNLPPQDIIATQGKYSVKNNRGGGVNTRYQWYQYNAGSWSAIVGKTSKDLLFNDIDPTYVGKKYRCEMTNDWISSMILYSSEFTIQSVSGFPIVAPSNLTTSAGSPTDVRLNWIDNTTNETGFEIERATTSGGAFMLVGNAAAGAISYSDAGLITGTKYYYRVRAVNASGSSAYTTEASATPNYNISDLIKEDSLRTNIIPPQLKITREGLRPEIKERPLLISGLNQGDVNPVFSGCIDGDYYIGFQLYYDLSDKQTTKEWLSQLTITLLNTQNVAIWTKPLQVNSKNQTFIETSFYDQLISCTGNYTFRIDQKIIVGEVPQGSVSLKVLFSKKSDAFNINASLSFVCDTNSQCGYNAVTGESKVCLIYSDAGVTEYDLEWVFIADHEVANPNAPIAEPFKLKEPVRITTAFKNYAHQIFYQKGRLWYRARAVGYNPLYPEHRIVSQWSSPCSPISIKNPVPSKNWQVQTVFAEDGKNKKVVHYFDGTLRTRQSQTNLSTEGITLSGETLYDFEGRKSAEILAAPYDSSYNSSYNSSLKFKYVLNTFQPIDGLVATNTSSKRKKFNYDNLAAENSILSPADGAGRYYSPANNKATEHSNFIPDAEGYVYSQTEYLNDGTGRVRRQSGVGKEFRIDRQDGNKGPTKYHYGSAAKVELIRLFGSNVGNASHYKKNLVVDANGQVSVSYHDQSDRVIASALAGNRPDNVDPLPSFTSLDGSRVTEDISNKNERAGSISVTSHKLLNTYLNTAYNFSYELKALNSQIDQWCPICKFELTITITDPDGELIDLGVIADNEASDQFSYLKKNITSASCPGGFNQIVQIGPLPSGLTLNKIGDYTITKTLKAVELTFDEMKTVVQQSASVQAKIQQLRDSYVPDASQCDICTSNNCTDTDKKISDVIDKVASLDCENIKKRIIEELIKKRPTDPNYYPTDLEISSDADFCRYKLCVLDKTSDVFEKQLALVPNWATALLKGYTTANNTPVDKDPFFNEKGLSGYGYKSNMVDRLNNIVIGVINANRDINANLRIPRPILEVLNPINPLYYIDDQGNATNSISTGYHVLYYELMKQNPADYATQLDKQRWSLYRAFYLEAKRKTKLSMPAYSIDCAKAKEDLEKTDKIPQTEADVNNWDKAAIFKTVSNQQIQMVFSRLKFSCNVALKFSTLDSLSITGYLKAYFNSAKNANNFFKLIFKTHLALDANNQISDVNLKAIDLILKKYGGCENALADAATIDPLVCKPGRTITVNFPIPTQLPNLVVNPGVTPTPTCTPFITNNGCYNGWSAQSGAPQVTSSGVIRLTGQKCNAVSSAVGGAVTLEKGLVPGKKYRFSVTYRALTSNDNVYCQFFNDDGYRRANASTFLFGQSVIPYPDGCPDQAFAASTGNATVAPNVFFDPCPNPGALYPKPVEVNGVLTNEVWSKQSVPQDAATWKTDEVIFTATEKSTNFVFSTIPNLGALGVNNSSNLTTWGTNGTFESAANNVSIPQMFLGTNTRGIVTGTAAKSAANGLSISNNAGPQSKGGVLLKFNAVASTSGASTFIANVWIKRGTTSISNNPAAKLFISFPGSDWEILSQNQVSFGAIDNCWANLKIRIARKPGAGVVPLPDYFTVSTNMTDLEFNTTGSLFVDDISVNGIDYTGVTQSIELKNVTIKEYYDSIRTFCIEYVAPTIPDYIAQYKAACLLNEVERKNLLAQVAIDNLLENEVTNFSNTYRTKCMDNAGETLKYTYIPKEYHYTLYYYDQAGNLVQTVPPEGVMPLRMDQLGLINPDHKLITRYQYNSLNQLLKQKTPDAGESNFWYNDKSQLKLSQNARQLIDNNYSYTKYDEQGRITEVGEMATTNPLSTLTVQLNDTNFPNAQAPSSNAYILTDITKTHYDFAAPMVLQWTNLSNVVVNGNSLTNTGGGYWVDHASSINSIPANVDGYLEFKVGSPTSNFEMGLSAIANSPNYTSISYGLGIEGGTVWRMENSNASVSLTTYLINDLFRIERRGTAIKYFKNGIEFYTSTVPSTTALYANCFLNTIGSTISNISMGLLEGNSSSGDQSTFIQRNLRNRVAWVEVTDKSSATPHISYQSSYKNDGANLDGVFYSAGAGSAASLESINGQNYIRVENICPGACQRAGAGFNGKMTVAAGESYLVRAKGYSVGSTPVQFYITGNTGSIYIAGGTLLPSGAASEGWIEQAFVVPNGITNLNVGLLWNPPAFGQVYYINEIQIIKKISDANNQLASFYSYDIHGNVKSLLQQIPGLANKRTDYVYDLVSGKVNFVMYQYAHQDQFIHSYKYDADNRIIEVSSSSDGFWWDRDAEYNYYLHGPMARTKLGHYSVQGSDYYYTLQGWLKGVNSPTGVNAQTNDPGQDGVGTSMVAKDVHAYNLGYYNGDYKPIGGATARAALLETNSTGIWNAVGQQPSETFGLYNGNIAWMATDLAKIGQVNGNRNTGVQAMQYNYDQLHRIVRSRSLSYATGAATRTNAAYDEDYTYDANGNIKTLLRNDNLAAVMDNFTYQYYTGTNRLRGVKPITDSVTYKQAVTSNTKLYSRITVTDDAYLPNGADVTLRATENIYVHKRFQKGVGKSFRAYIDNTGPYIYDAIGNLIADQNEGATISWTPYGKVRDVKTKGDSITVSYRYDAAGNRVAKRVATLTKDALLIEELTNYLRDASGNVMAIYKTPSSGGNGAGGEAFEQPIYGSSRLGQYHGGRKEGQQRFGRKNYELTNHLGNVLTVITDNINMSATDGVYATVVSATDYYPFGLEMKGRTFSNDQYRYGFNGKEKDNFSDQVYDYGFRIYNPRLAKFLSVDPLTRSYPWYTPYQFAGNKPIAAVDLDGKEELIRINYRENAGGTITKTLVILVNNEDVKKETFYLFLDLASGIDLSNDDEYQRFNNLNSFWLEGYQDYEKGALKPWGNDIITKGQLTIDVHKDKYGDFYNFSYSKTITEDASYKSAVSEQNFGVAYDLAGGTQKLGNGTAAVGLGVTATVVGSEVGVPMMAVGNSIALGGDVAEIVIDVFHGDYKEAAIIGGSNVPDQVFNYAAKKTTIGKAYKAVRESISTIIGLGANQIAEKANASQKKPSAKKINESNATELKSIGN